MTGLLTAIAILLTIYWFLTPSKRNKRRNSPTPLLGEYVRWFNNSSKLVVDSTRRLGSK